MNSVVWIGKILGCAVFEPLLERVGYKKVIYIVCFLQVIAVISKLDTHTTITREMISD